MYIILNISNKQTLVESNSRDYAIVTALDLSRDGKEIAVLSPGGDEVIRFLNGEQINLSD